MIIGITGGTGSGKSTLLQQIAQKNGLVLDCDEIYHQLLQSDQNLLQSIENTFPGTVSNGTLDRKKLGAIVFNDESALQELNHITHTAVKAEVLRQLEKKPALVAIDAIGLFEGALSELCHTTLAITAPEEVRISRLMARDGITENQAAARIHAQKKQDWFVEKCDYHLHNDGTMEAFRCKCIALYEKLGIIEK